jgi:uncharacterized protein YhaN
MPSDQERIATLEANNKSMSDKIDDIKKAVDEGFKDIKEEFKCFREEADKKYASKLTETIVYALVGIILVAVIGEVITLVLK